MRSTPTERTLPNEGSQKGDRIVFLTGQSRYDVLTSLARDLARAFTERGFRVDVLSLLAPDCLHQLAAAFVAGDVRCVVGVQGWGAELKANGRSIYDRFGVPLVAIFGDHPAHHVARIGEDIKNYIPIFINEEHRQWARPYYRHSLVDSWGCGGFFVPDVVPAFRARPFDVVFPGSAPDLAEIEAFLRDVQPPILGDILREVIDASTRDRSRSTQQVFESCLRDYGLELAWLKPAFRTNVLQALDLYVRGRRRIAILGAIKRFPITIMGEGWTRCSLENRNIRIVSEGYRTGSDLMSRTKIVLNIMPNFSYGTNDRIVRAMICGAVSLTDMNPFLEQLRDHDRVLLGYAADGHDLDDVLYEAFADEDELAALARRALGWVVRKNSIHLGVDGILRLLRTHELARAMDDFASARG